MTTENQIKKFISENFLFGDRNNNLKNDDSLLEKGIIDSTGVLEMVSFIEDTFNIEIKDEEIIPENLDSINNIVAFINGK